MIVVSLFGLFGLYLFWLCRLVLCLLLFVCLFDCGLVCLFDIFFDYTYLCRLTVVCYLVIHLYLLVICFVFCFFFGFVMMLVCCLCVLIAGCCFRLGFMCCLLLVCFYVYFVVSWLGGLFLIVCLLEAVWRCRCFCCLFVFAAVVSLVCSFSFVLASICLLFGMLLLLLFIYC